MYFLSAFRVVSECDCAIVPPQPLRRPRVQLKRERLSVCVGRSQATGKLGCLFNVRDDPGEHNDLALAQPALAAQLRARMQAAEATWFNPDRGEPDQRACHVAERTGFWGPFL